MSGLCVCICVSVCRINSILLCYNNGDDILCNHINDDNEM